MKKVKKQKTYLQKYQIYFNKKVAAVCAMTLTVSSLLSPLATSATSSEGTSYPILISSVSEELNHSNDYIDVDLNYFDMEGTNLGVSMDVEINLDQVKKDQEQLEVEEETTNIPSNNSAIENSVESSDDTKIDSENEVINDTIEVENPVESSDDTKTDFENEVIDEAIEVENPVLDEQTESVSNVETKEDTVENNEELIEDSEEKAVEDINEVSSTESIEFEEQENSSDENVTSDLTEPVAMNHSNNRDSNSIKENSILNTFGQWLTNIFKSVILTSEVVAEAAEVEANSIVFNFPIHSSFKLDKSTLKVTGTNGEELTQYLVNFDGNHLILEFKDSVPSQFNVSFILDLSEKVQSGQVIVNEGAVIQYTLGNKVINEELSLPQMMVNLYVAEIMALPSIQSSLMQIDEANEDTSSTKKTENLSNGNTLFIDKIATKQNDGSYLIELDTNGIVNTTTTVNQADVVLVVDASSSMSDKIAAIKQSIKQFTQDILAINDRAEGAVRVAIVTYSSSATDLSGGFVTSYTDVENKITNMQTSRGTNTEAGIRLAANLLSTDGRSGADKYVVFFTDGLPTNSDLYPTSNLKSYGRHFKAAQEAYYAKFSGKLEPNEEGKISVGGLGEVENNSDKDKESPYTPTSSPINAKFYTIGLFTNSNSSQDTMAISFLKTIQNVIDMSSYGANYYTNDINKAQTIYTTIKNDIIEQITGNLLTGAKIMDIVPSYFDIVEGSFTSTIDGVVPTVKPNYTGNNEKKITWDFPSLSASGVKVSFKVVPNNDYFGGVEEDGSTLTPIPTNKNATIVATELPNGATYPVPTVTIAPVEGGIKVVKEVKKGESQYQTNDTFSINVTGESNQLGFEVTGNTHQIVSFYLRNSDTDISYNEDYSKNYLMVGTYSVNEVIPANYQQSGIEIKECTDSTYQSCTLLPTQNKTFTIDKARPYILITVKNNLSNENYWYDQAHTPNRFAYIKPSDGTEE